MKSTNLSIFFILLLFVFQSCMPVASDKSSSESLDINVDELSQDSQTTYKMKIGEKISFKTNVHGSVGMGAEHEISDEKIVKLEGSETIYNNPNFDAPGGDAAMQKFTFTALSKGKTKVKIKKIFRGDLEKEIVFDVEVI